MNEPCDFHPDRPAVTKIEHSNAPPGEKPIANACEACAKLFKPDQRWENVVCDTLEGDIKSILQVTQALGSDRFEFFFDMSKPRAEIAEKIKRIRALESPEFVASIPKCINHHDVTSLITLYDMSDKIIPVCEQCFLESEGK